MEVSLSPNASAKDVLKSISTFEREYQLSLNEAYAELGDSTFKDLRRALPVTKQKLDWNRSVLHISLADLADDGSGHGTGLQATNSRMTCRNDRMMDETDQKIRLR